MVGIAIVGGIVALLLVVVSVVLVLDAANDHHHDHLADPPDSGEGWTYPGPSGREVALATDGRRVCATDADELFCIESVDGDELFDVALPGAATQPALAGETLVVAADGGAGRGDIHGYSLDGEPLWEAAGIQNVDVESLVDYREPLAAAGDVVVAPLGELGLDGIIGVDARSGQELWRVPGPGPNVDFTVTGNLVSDGHRFYGNASIVDDDAVPGAGIVALDPATGGLLWHLQLADEPELVTNFLRTAAAVDDGMAVALGVYGEEKSETVVLDAATGTERWRVPMETTWGGLAHLDGVTVIADGTALRGYDSEGTELWETPMPGTRPTEREDVPSPKLVVAGDRVYALRGHLVAVDTEDGATDIVLEHFAPRALVATDDHLVVAGMMGWEAVPL